MSAIAEFLARCALALRRRLFPRRRRKAAPAVVGPRVPASALAAGLEALGILPGSVLMVHSGMRAVHRLGLEPSELLDLLLDYLGPRGTLAMPTHPLLACRDGGLVYDVRRSPSTVGLLTEIFRRRPGAMRSRYPYSSVAASGARAEELVSGHEGSFAPHDERSPYSRLADIGGRVLCFGVPVDRMTILHVAEDCLRDALPIANFYEERRVLIVADGRESSVVAHVRAPWLWWFLNLRAYTRSVMRKGLVRERELAGVPLRAAVAHDVVEWMKADIRAGKTIYPLASMNRFLRLGVPPLEAP